MRSLDPSNVSSWPLSAWLPSRRRARAVPPGVHSLSRRPAGALATPVGATESCLCHVAVDRSRASYTLSVEGGHLAGLELPALYRHLHYLAVGSREPANAALSALHVVIHADGEVPCGAVQDVVAHCARIGVWRITLAGRGS